MVQYFIAILCPMEVNNEGDVLSLILASETYYAYTRISFEFYADYFTINATDHNFNSLWLS